jgi:hypothetical protein
MNAPFPTRTRTAAGLAGGLCAALGVTLAMAAPAHADAPTRTPVAQTVVSTDSNVCGFPVDITSVQTGFATISSDVTSADFHLTEQDTFTANGNSLTSAPYRFNIHFTLDAQGNFVHAYATGQLVLVPLPGGVTFRAAGRVDFVTSPGFAVVPDSGGSHHRDAFCAALAG